MPHSREVSTTHSCIKCQAMTYAPCSPVLDSTMFCRLVCSLMQHGRNNGKKLMAVSLTSKHPIFTPVPAVKCSNIIWSLKIKILAMFSNYFWILNPDFPPWGDWFVGPHCQTRFWHHQPLDRQQPHPNLGGCYHQQVILRWNTWL